MPLRQLPRGFRVIVVSNMSKPAGSVAVDARPLFPQTCSTSGNWRSRPSWMRRISLARAILTPGNVVGINRIVPSSTGGMNSLPIRDHGIQVTISVATAIHTTGHRWRSTEVINGRYILMRNRLIGFARSRKIRPRTKAPIITGTSVTDSKLDAAIANVFVNANGRKSRPSCPSSVNTGRNETVMISNEKNSAGPTSCAASTTTCQRS